MTVDGSRNWAFVGCDCEKDRYVDVKNSERHISVVLNAFSGLEAAVITPFTDSYSPLYVGTDGSHEKHDDDNENCTRALHETEETPPMHLKYFIRRLGATGAGR